MRLALGSVAALHALNGRKSFTNVYRECLCQFRYQLADRFLCRQSRLKTTWSQALTNLRAAAASPANITAWMEKLWMHWDANKLGFADVWSFDEKSVQAGGIHCLKIVVCKTRINLDRQRRGPGDRKNLTLIECCSHTWASCITW